MGLLFKIFVFSDLHDKVVEVASQKNEIRRKNVIGISRLMG